MQCNVSTVRIYIISMYIYIIILRKTRSRICFNNISDKLSPHFFAGRHHLDDLHRSAAVCRFMYIALPRCCVAFALDPAWLLLVVSSKLQKQTACRVNLWILEFLRPRPVFKWTQAIMDVFDSENPSEQQKRKLLTKPHSSSNGISMLELGGLCRVQSIGHGLQQTIWEKLGEFLGFADLLICILPPVLPFVPEIEYHHPHGSCSIGLTLPNHWYRGASHTVVWNISLLICYLGMGSSWSVYTKSFGTCLS